MLGNLKKRIKIKKKKEKKDNDLSFVKTILSTKKYKY